MVLRGITVSYKTGHNFGYKNQIRVLKIVHESLARHRLLELVGEQLMPSGMLRSGEHPDKSSCCRPVKQLVHNGPEMAFGFAQHQHNKTLALSCKLWCT